MQFDTLKIPRLDPDKAIRPIESLNELIDLFLAALESVLPGDDIERLLDGVARLCAQRRNDFSELTGPLLKRARQRANQRSYANAFIMRRLATLASAWIDDNWKMEAVEG